MKHINIPAVMCAHAAIHYSIDGTSESNAVLKCSYRKLDTEDQMAPIC